MAAGDRRITGTTSGNVRVRRTSGDTRIISTAAGGGGTTGILRNLTRAIERGHSGVAAAQLGGVLA